MHDDDFLTSPNIWVRTRNREVEIQEMLQFFFRICSFCETTLESSISATRWSTELCFGYVSDTVWGIRKKRAESPRTHHWPLRTSSGLRGFGILEILHKFPNQSYFKTPKWAVGTTYSVVEYVLSVLSTHKRDCKVDQAAYWPQSEFEISPVPKKEQIRKKNWSLRLLYFAYGLIFSLRLKSNYGLSRTSSEKKR